MTFSLGAAVHGRPLRALACGAFLLGLSGCGLLSSDGVTRSTVDVDARGDAVGPFDNDPETEGTLFGDLGATILGDDEDETAGVQLPINRHLWQASLDTLAFLPLSSTDPYGGVIVTDWGSPQNKTQERFKVTAFITSAVLRPQSLRVVVNRQLRDDGGAWAPASVAPETARRLEDAILTRARQIKLSEESG